MAFDYSLDFKTLDFRKNPELYRVGRGEQGVFHVQPYKSELLPHWRFKTPAIARASADALYAKYLAYRAEEDFVGMDMARKYIQMGFTRARRYANHKSGRKYAPDGKTLLPREEDPVKAEAARIFKATLEQIKADAAYQALKKQHQTQYGA